MNTTNFIDIALYLIIAILVVTLLGTLSKSRFTKTIFKDEFRSKSEIGKQNLGKLKKEQSYKDLARERQLEEAKKIEPKLNPKVTRSITEVTKDIRDTDD